MYFWSLINFVQNDFPKKTSFSALKKHFFLQKMQYLPLLHPTPLWCQETFFPMVFLYLNPEGQLKAT